MGISQGRLIVIEGIDGSGKTTQVNFLAKYLEEKNIPYEVISFPQYEDNLYGKLIRRYLEGEFGSINQVNPYLLALAYAGDRFLAKPKIEKWLAEGKVVLANRYTPSSKAHLGANLPEEKRGEFFNWLDQLEYQTHGLPEPDLTILLTVDPKISQRNVSGGGIDIHEDDLNHLREARRIYLSLAQKETNWQVIECMKEGKMRPPQDIHQELLDLSCFGSLYNLST